MIFGRFLASKGWAERWAEGRFPRRYSPELQREVDAEFWALACEDEKIPGGATPVGVDAQGPEQGALFA